MWAKVRRFKPGNVRISPPRLPDRAAGPLRRAAAGACLLSAAGLVGMLVWPEPQAAAARPLELTLGEYALQTQGDPAIRALELATEYLAETVTLEADGQTLSMRRQDLGARVDLEHLTRLLREADDSQSTLRRVHDAAGHSEQVPLQMPATLHGDSARGAIIQLKDQLDQPAQSARIDPRAQQLMQAKPGRLVDVPGSLVRIERALLDGDSRIELRILAIAPGRDLSDFGKIDMGHTLGEFETRYSRGDKARARTHNLRIAAAHLDGQILRPGETFDFNGAVGQRSEARGFRMAPVIANGRLDKGMGGGTCQIASTLHAAVFFAGLPILSRHPHSRPSFYIKLGLDATVTDTGLNFRFENNRDYPVVIGMTVKGGRVTASLHGAARHETVSFLRRIDEAVPFREKEIEDSNLPAGLRVLAQRGIPGFNLTRFRVIRDGRTGVARRERTNDSYPPTTQLWRVGTGGEPGDDFVRPANDAHPEYVADEYLSATQGPGIDGARVVRTAGKTGNYGWTVREGMIRSLGGG